MIVRILFTIIFIIFQVSSAFSADIEPRLKALEEMLLRQQKTIDEQNQLVNRLKEELSTTRSQVPEKKSESQSAASAKPDHESHAGKGEGAGKGEAEKTSGALDDFFKNMKLPALTFVLNSFYYSSSVNERNLKRRGITGFTSTGLDQSKGFNIDEFSIAAFAPVDKYFDLFGVMSFTEEGASIEEAYFYTKTLPADLRLKAGKFKSNFSVHNELHPHDWDFADTSLIYKGFLGKDGIVETGAQLTWRPKLPLRPFIGVEALQGDNATMFNQNSTGGPHAFTAFAKGFHLLGKDASVYFGPYVISGKTRTDSVAEDAYFQGNSTLYGFEADYIWKPSEERSLNIRGEYMWRNQEGNLQNILLNTMDRLSRSQDGAYIQALYQMGKWRAGVRYDRLNLLTDTYRLAGTQQNFQKPWRLTGALEFNPSEHSRFRLQYNYDRSGGGSPAYGGGPRTNHEVFLQMVFSFGAHLEPAGQRD